MMKPVTLGVVIGNRGFFPDALCVEGREAILAALERAGIEAVLPAPDATSFAGAVETLKDAHVCADLFKAHADRLDGILVTLPNFGDERAVANTLRWAGLRVPVLVHAFADDSADMTIRRRRDSFCGKMSVCNNLRQYGIAYTLTSEHTQDPGSEGFAKDLEMFAGVCRVVKALRGARLGMIGARPAAFNTVRFSERLLEASGISVETWDLSEVLGRAARLSGSDAEVRAKLEAIKAYTETGGTPDDALEKMARFGVVIDRWMAENELSATAIQCWTALEEFYGVVPCTLMSMMSNALHSSACETDIGGLVGMHALAAASGRPSAILDWNNNYGNDPDKGVLFHCSNLPRDWFVRHRMDYQAIIAGSVGRENTYGTIVGRIKPSPFTFCRIATDDLHGRVAGYLGEGRFTDDPLETFGGYGVVEIPGMQKLLRYICENGFEHHVAANLSTVADAVEEALSTYLGWTIYRHRG